jgi:hypothetical protein
MKLYSAIKNQPFALDVQVAEDLLTYRIRSVIQGEWVGNPTKEHPQGGKYFDERLVSEWRGNFAVHGEVIHERSISLKSLQVHPEFGDHSAFMLYAPVGLAASGSTRESLFEQTPNLYVGTFASKMDAQAYHATVLQTHPIGHVLIPFKSSPISDWTLGFNVFDPVLIKASAGIEIIPAITLAIVRDETLPTVRFMDGPVTTALANQELTLAFRLETPQGSPIEDRESEVYLDSTTGYLVTRRVVTKNGLGTAVFNTMGMTSGQRAKLKVGFKFFSGTDDLDVVVE